MMQDPQPVFRALADPTRRQILMSLRNQDLSIAEVSGQFDITRAAVKKHLTILEEGQLIHVEARGRERVNSLVPENLRAAASWLDYFSGFWDERLNALQEAINQTENKT